MEERFEEKHKQEIAEYEEKMANGEESPWVSAQKTGKQTRR